MARRRHARRHSRRSHRLHGHGEMGAFSFDSSDISWGAVGVGLAIGAGLAYYWMKPKGQSSSMQGLGAAKRVDPYCEMRRNLCLQKNDRNPGKCPECRAS